eukprot:3755296-Amphidinium_carterae.1
MSGERQGTRIRSHTAQRLGQNAATLHVDLRLLWIKTEIRLASLSTKHSKTLSDSVSNVYSRYSWGWIVLHIPDSVVVLARCLLQEVEAETSPLEEVRRMRDQMRRHQLSILRCSRVPIDKSITCRLKVLLDCSI